MRWLTLTAIVALVSLAGCGAQAVEDAPSLDEVAAATRADPYRFELTLESTGVPDPFTGKATGGADPNTDRGFVRYAVEGEEEEESFTFELRRIGGETFTRVIGLGLNGWTKEQNAEADVLGPFGGFSEPHRAADALAQHGRDVKAEPGGQVDGVATTHYRGTVPAIEIMAGSAGEQRTELEAELRETGSELAEVDAWAGADGVLRKLELEIPLREDGREGRLESSARFFDFGKAVVVERPSTDELEPERGVSVACSGTTEPHTAAAVMSAFRDDGFEVNAVCAAGETSIIATPTNEEDGEVVVCMVYRAPDPREDLSKFVVAGNVACLAETADSRKAVRTLLDRL